jgi:radical SAM enzyme (TIGR01210 family)
MAHFGGSDPAVVIYPASGAGRDAFVLDRRPSRPARDPWRAHDLLIEDERIAEGRVVRSATVFLTGRECPWRCAMCDLWQYTTGADTPAGAIPAQVVAARDRLGREPAPVAQIKLYNASSFFDPRAVPDDDYAAIAAAVSDFDDIVVESHPSLIGPRVDRWREQLSVEATRVGHAVRLQVAMGLETTHPSALEQLNKRMTVDGFLRAAEGLRRGGVGLRVFVLIAPPFVPRTEQDAWLLDSVRLAFESGACVVSLIPTRDGNGTLEALAGQDEFRSPDVYDIERSAELALAQYRHRGLIFVDLWDLERFTACGICYERRRDRLHRMNLDQHVPPAVVCDACGQRA